MKLYSEDDGEGDEAGDDEVKQSKLKHFLMGILEAEEEEEAAAAAAAEAEEAEEAEEEKSSCTPKSLKPVATS